MSVKEQKRDQTAFEVAEKHWASQDVKVKGNVGGGAAKSVAWLG